MTPKDPNFPQEIPPIPPPRDRSEPGVDKIDPQTTLDNLPIGPRGTVPSNVEGPNPENGLEGTGRALGVTHQAGSETKEHLPSPDPAPWTDSDLRETDNLPAQPFPPTQAKPPYNTPGSEPAASGSRNPRSIQPSEDVWADTDVPYQPKELGVVDQLLLVLADGVALWKRLLRWVRSQLPPNLQRQLSDEILTAIALGLLILFLALWNPLSAGRGPRAVAAHEPLPRLTAIDPSPAAETPLDNPASPLPPEAPQVLEPTPEQRLIADIQARVSAISRSYGAGLIQSVEVNLTGNTLGVNLDEAWYGLLPAQQDEIAQDIYNQAQGLKFSTLQLRDPNGLVVARNPVVGTTMVVLHRLRHEPS